MISRAPSYVLALLFLSTGEQRSRLRPDGKNIGTLRNDIRHSCDAAHGCPLLLPILLESREHGQLALACCWDLLRIGADVVNR